MLCISGLIKLVKLNLEVKIRLETKRFKCSFFINIQEKTPPPQKGRILSVKLSCVNMHLTSCYTLLIIELFSGSFFKENNMYALRNRSSVTYMFVRIKRFFHKTFNSL